MDLIEKLRKIADEHNQRQDSERRARKGTIPIVIFYSILILGTVAGLVALTIWGNQNIDLLERFFVGAFCGLVISGVIGGITAAIVDWLLHVLEN